jgi:hypothetical protein
MGSSRDFDDLAARFGGRIQPVERERRPLQHRTFKQIKADAYERNRKRSKMWHIWLLEGYFFERVRESISEQDGREPDQPPEPDPWGRDR